MTEKSQVNKMENVCAVINFPFFIFVSKNSFSNKNKKNKKTICPT